MRQIYLILFIVFAYSLKAQTIESFVPKNWKLIYKTSGDLNNDLIADAVIIIEENNKENYKLNESLGKDTLNLNPRNLIVLLRLKNGKFKLEEKNDLKFTPSENDEENTCLEDPLLETNGIEIKNGLLFVKFNYFKSCGSWTTTTTEFTFRFQNKKLKLIGFDYSSTHRANGNENSLSINFITKEKIVYSGGNVFDETKNKSVYKKSKIQFMKLINLSDCNDKTYSKLLDIN